MAVRVNAETFAAEVLQAKGLVLVDFYSDSCVPCKRIAPLLSEVAAADPDGLKVVKVNINFDAELAEQYAVQAAPTLVFFQNGAEVARLRGLVKKAELTEVIDSLKNKFIRSYVIMKITVAGVTKEVADGLTVAQLIEQEKVETPQYVTVTINDDFVESGTFETTVLKDGDNVEFLYFMGGGQ